MQNLLWAFMDVLINNAIKIAYVQSRPKLALPLAELALKLDPNNVELMRHLAFFLIDSERCLEGFETAKLCFSLCETSHEKVFANHIIIKSLMTATGFWHEIPELVKRHKDLISKLLQEAPTNLDEASTLRLFTASFFFPYIKDDPKNNHFLQNRLSDLCKINFGKLSSRINIKVPQNFF